MKKHTSYLWALTAVLILSLSGAWTSVAMASVGTTHDNSVLTIAKGGKKKDGKEAKDADKAAKKSKKMAEKAAKKNGKKAGMDAEKIKSVQEALIADGYTVKSTGKMDKETRKALKEYQKKNKLKATGKPDKATLKAMGL